MGARSPEERHTYSPCFHPPACAAMAPPCELLVRPKPQWQQTYVVLGDTEAWAAFKTFALVQGVDGAGMWAIHRTRSETFLAITLGKAGCEKSNVPEIQEGLYKLPGAHQL